MKPGCGRATRSETNEIGNTGNECASHRHREPARRFGVIERRYPRGSRSNINDIGLVAQAAVQQERSEQGGEGILLLPDLSQEALANIIGSTRPRVNGFLNRFRKLGYVEYNGRIRVRTELLSAFLRENGAGLPGRDPDYCWRARKRSMNFVSNSPARNSVS
jgi:hypothetical protein